MVEPVAHAAGATNLDGARRLLWEQVAEGAGIVDASDGEFRVVDANPALRQLGAAPAGEVTGRPWREAFPALGDLTDVFGAVVSSGTGIETTGTVESGSHLSRRCLPFFDGTGHVESIVVLVRSEVSPVAPAAPAPAPWADLERVPQPLLIVEGAERTVRLVNSQFARLAGQPAAELLGRTLPAGLLDCFERATRAATTGALVECSLTAPGASDKENWTLAIVPLPSSPGAPARTLVLGFDTAIPGRERQRARQSAAAALWRVGQLEAVFGAMVDGVLVLDETGRVVEANEAALSILGLTENSESRQVADYLAPLMPPGEVDRATSVGTELLAGVLAGRVLPDEQLTLLAPNGEESAVSLRGAPVRDAHGDIVGAVVVLRDVTDQRRINQEKDAFLSVISHEVKSPLTSIKGFAQLAGRAASGPQGDRLRGHVRVIEQQVSRIERLIDDLVNVDSASEAALREEPVVFDLASLARVVLEQQQVTVAGHRLVLLGGSDRLPILADPARIEQVLTNLITNAVKYSPEAGEVTVGIDGVGTTVHLWVRDEGIGIPRAEMGRLFDRFYRASNARRRGYGGLGLGLYVVNEIVQRSRGQIWVESDEGSGTTFHITLPLHESAPS